MGCLGNMLWFIFGGFFIGLSWLIIGCLWCVSIVGIPIGLQCFKFAGLSFFPFGKEVEYGGGAGSLLINLLWLIFGGLAMAIESVMFGVILCITIVGIPFGLQHFKIAKLALMPVGAKIR
ncbi:MAG TPA: YccF domain-containing protein [Mobilitalea sp.]|nr:YccF domain-containing protein [Mobilitalea sp.]